MDEVIPAETGLLGLLCYAGLLLGRVVAVLGPLAASATPGAVGTATGPLGRPTTSERADGGYSAVRLILAALEIFGGGGVDRKRLLMAVDRRGTPVGFVSLGTDVLVVVFGELQADGGG